MCSKPYREGVMEYGCGQCLPCRINRRRVWSSRLMLEANLHVGASWFVTLTYDEAHLPSDRSVVPRDLQLFIKRVRKEVSPCRVRYYGVGEYGDVSGRPHYHVLLFGVVDPSVVGKAWRLGMVHVGNVTPQSVSYVVSYVLKGMTQVSDSRLAGRHPEFARMSLKPGIGGDAGRALLDATATVGGASYVIREGDVPSRVRSDGKMWPLGRYLLNRLRADYGMDESQRIGVVARRAMELQALLSVRGERDLHEQKRLQASRRARSLFQISRSKKGIGL